MYNPNTKERCSSSEHSSAIEVDRDEERKGERDGIEEGNGITTTHVQAGLIFGFYGAGSSSYIQRQEMERKQQERARLPRVMAGGQIGSNKRQLALDMERINQHVD